MRVVSAEPDDVVEALPDCYREACRLAERGQYDEARRLYAEIEEPCSSSDSGPRLRALVRNDLGVLAALDGHHDDARHGWRAALEIDPECLPARLNRDLLEAELDYLKGPAEPKAELELAPNLVESGSDLVSSFFACPGDVKMLQWQACHDAFASSTPTRSTT